MVAVPETIDSLKAKLDFFETQLIDKFTAQEQKMEGLQLQMTLKVDDSLENHKTQILADAQAAKTEFDQVKTDHKDLYDNAHLALKDVNEKYNKFYLDADTEVKALKARVGVLETGGSSSQGPDKKGWIGTRIHPNEVDDAEKLHRQN